jgi:hypothetical protein
LLASRSRLLRLLRWRREVVLTPLVLRDAGNIVRKRGLDPLRVRNLLLLVRHGNLALLEADAQARRDGYLGCRRGGIDGEERLRVVERRECGRIALGDETETGERGGLAEAVTRNRG